MSAKEAGKMVGGSIAIYVIMAACSAANGPLSFAANDGGGSSSGANGDGSGGILDALTDPVSAASADPNQSGTRLKLNYYAGTDGSNQSVGTMHDSMLNVDCSFQTTSDGTLRCVPLYGYNPQAMVTSYFADSGCTQPLALHYKGCTAPDYAVGIASETCAGADTWHVYPASVPYTGTSYYSGAPGSCSAATPIASLITSFDVYTVGSELPPSTFVQATVQTE